MSRNHPKAQLSPQKPGKVRQLLQSVPGEARELFAYHLAGKISAPVTLAGLLFALGSGAEVESVLESLEDADPRFAILMELFRRNPERLAAIAPLLAQHPEMVDGGEAAITACRRFFDTLVAASEEASVALYSLGDAEILAQGTEEIVATLDRWGLLDAGHRALEIGSGIGRFQVALAGRLCEVHGIEISEKMLAAARRRAAGLANVYFHHGTGRDLSPFADTSFEMVFAVDSFPYIEQSGPQLVETYFAETARVLRPGGDFAILNLSYSGDLDAEAGRFSELCEQFGFVVEVPGARQFELWDGAAFLARRKR